LVLPIDTPALMRIGSPVATALTLELDRDFDGRGICR